MESKDKTSAVRTQSLRSDDDADKQDDDDDLPPEEEAVVADRSDGFHGWKEFPKAACPLNKQLIAITSNKQRRQQFPFVIFELLYVWICFFLNSF